MTDIKFYGKFFDDGTGGHSGGGHSTAIDFKLGRLDGMQKALSQLGRMAADFGRSAADIAAPFQNHTTDVIYVDAPEFRNRIADGIVTDKPGIILCIRAADCAPIMLSDKKNGVIGAIHAGWRGAINGVIENTIAEMIRRGARQEHIAATIGPMLMGKSFVAKDNMLALLASVNPPGYEKHLIEHNKLHFNFEEFIQNKLIACGINRDRITMPTIDTATSPEWYSYRRRIDANLELDGHNTALICMNC